MKHRLLIALIALPFLAVAGAGDQDYADVLKPIHSLFDGMREGNGDKVRLAFAQNAVMQRAHAELRLGSSPEQFATAVENKGDQIWDEQIWDVTVQIDDKLASVWTQFIFYRNEQVSHCGVNSFQLYHFEDGWKIIHLVDTFRDKDCNGPKG